MNRKIAIAVAALMLGAGPVWAQAPKAKAPTASTASQFSSGFAAYNSGDYATALRLWRPLAEQGDAEAQVNLGVMYSNGRGVPQDYAAAVGWYRKAADQGYASAQYNLGLMYDNGQGVPQDYAAAAGWYRKAADQGLAQAQYNLGAMYDNGQGVPQDYAAAHKWFNLSAARATDADVRDRAVRNRDRVAALMTPAQIAEAQRLASEWRPTK